MSSPVLQSGFVHSVGVAHPFQRCIIAPNQTFLGRIACMGQIIPCVDGPTSWKLSEPKLISFGREMRRIMDFLDSYQCLAY